MKKVKFVFIPVILICIVFALMSVSACAANRLEVPQNVSVNLDNYTVSWSKVDNARGYDIEAKSTGNSGETQIFEVGSTKISCSLQTLSEGDYEVRVRASARNNSNYSDSRWSDSVKVSKDYYSGCTFSLISNDTEYEVTGWTKPDDDTTDIVIPAEFRGKPVVGIADNAFKSKTSLTSVTIEETEEGGNLRYIGKNAFYSCTKLTSINLPESLTEIEEGAFHSCRVLRTVRIPSGITEIADSTFLYCRGLTKVDLGNVESIGTSAFLGCNDSGCLTELVIPDTVKTIGEKAFSNCSELEKVTVGSGVEEIGGYAFQNDKALTEVEFKDGEAGGTVLEEIGEYAFSGCSELRKVTLPQGLETIDSYAFYKDTELSDINIPSSVTKIGEDAFRSTKIYTDQEEEVLVCVGEERADTDNKVWVVGYNEDNLQPSSTTGEYIIEDTAFGGNVIGIADYAFYKTERTDVVNIPSNVQYIGDYAFYGGKKLSTVLIYGVRTGTPATVELGVYAFASLSNLSNFRFNSYGFTSGVVSIGDYCFYGDKILYEVDIPTSVERIGSKAFYNTLLYDEKYGYDKTNNVVYAGGGGNTSGKKWVVGYGSTYYDTSVTLDSDTYGIADYAFSRNTIVESIVNLQNVKYIGEGAFYKCSSLSDISITTELTALEPYTFYGCTSLKRLGAGQYDYDSLSNLTSIGRSAFYNCSSLETLDLSKSPVEYIGMYAFYGCSSLSELTFTDNNLKEIDDIAFYKSGITTLDLPESIERIGAKAFYRCEKLNSVNIGTGDVDLTIDDYAFYRCTGLEKFSVPGRVEEIGDYAFYKCTNLEELDLNEGLERIGIGAFASTAIRTLHIPSTVREIDDYAFKSCTELTSVIIPNTCEYIGENAFYGVSNATFYTNAKSILPQWSSRFNSSYRPIVWGCTLSEDGTHVVSVEITAENVENVIRIEGNEEGETEDSGDVEENMGQVNYSLLCAAPEWENHTFVGWSLTDGGEIIYFADQIDYAYAEHGLVTLYAIWE